MQDSQQEVRQILGIFTNLPKIDAVTICYRILSPEFPALSAGILLRWVTHDNPPMIPKATQQSVLS